MHVPDRWLKLREHVQQSFPAEELAKSTVRELGKVYGVEYKYDFADDDSPIVSLTPAAVVGVARLTDGTVVRFAPKVPVANVFGMWDLANGARMKLDWSTYAGIDTVDGLYDAVARQFIRQIRARIVRGLHRTYEQQHGRLAAVRGRIDLAESIRRPWQPELHCRYEEHEPDNLLNRLLLWALYCIIRSAALLKNDTRGMAAGVFRTLSGAVSLVEYRPRAYRGIYYTRLTRPYAPLHAMGCFFVEHATPALPGEARRKAVPFWISMPELFEQFVAEWLRSSAPHGMAVRKQYPIKLRHSSGYSAPVYSLRADIVLVSEKLGPRPFAVLDTKYKTSGKPDETDINQVHTYATQLGVGEAWLIYPKPLEEPLDITMASGVRIRSVAFDIGDDLEAAGRRFLSEIRVGE